MTAGSPLPPGALVVPILLVLLMAAAAAAEVAPAPAPLAGILPTSEATRERWPWCGAWRYPVGDARDYRESSPAKESGYRLLRSVGGPDFGTETHTGVDLGCGHGGGFVRAAAAGIVVRARREGWNGGYGLHVVLAHRLADGRVVYSIYAHLGEGTIRVRPGQMVAAGDRLGRVGRSGRATTPHLHFEIRPADSTARRWEKEPFVDPLEFVGDRLAPSPDSDTLGRYVEWAQYAGLITDSLDATGPLDRGRWWRMLAVASRHGLERLPERTAELAESLVAAGVLPEASRDDALTLDWAEIARDLRRLHHLGARLPVRPVADGPHRRACLARLGVADPSASLKQLAKRDPGRIATRDAVLAIADYAPALEPPRRKKARPPAPAPGAAAPAARDSSGK